MKTIGMIGGMSWESTVTYYQAINQGIKSQLGGLHSAKLCLYSVDFAEIEELQRQGDWPSMAAILTDAALSLQAAGVDFLLICTNTMHKVVPDIESHISIPIVHIADATAEQLLQDGITKVGLLGTRFTMEQEFYKQRLIGQYGMAVVIPDEEDRNAVHEIIYDELCCGVLRPESKRRYLDIIDDLVGKGAQAIILGCTEIGLLINQQDTSIPLYDTAEIHAQYAVALALKDSVD
jgi:aspartate racemase